MTDFVSFDFSLFKSFFDEDIEKYESQYSVMLDINGPAISNTVGFHFSIDDDEPDSERNFKEMADYFKPMLILVGTEELSSKLAEIGYLSQVVPYFESGGFMVMFKVPLAKCSQ